MKIRDLQFFVTAARSKSLSEAARGLGVPALAMSKRLAALEKEVGAILLRRASRPSRLTSAGRTFLPYAELLVEAARSGLEQLSACSEPSHQRTLKLFCTWDVGTKLISDAVALAMSRQAGLKFEVSSGPGFGDCSEEEPDLLVGSGVKRIFRHGGRQLGLLTRGFYASPAYLAQHGAPLSRADLIAHDVMELAARKEAAPEVRIRNEPEVLARFSANSPDMLRWSCLQGAGIALLTDYDAAEDVAVGRLVPVTIADHVPEPVALWSFSPDQMPLQEDAEIFNDMVADCLRSSCDKGRQIVLVPTANAA